MRERLRHSIMNVSAYQLWNCGAPSTRLSKESFTGLIIKDHTTTLKEDVFKLRIFGYVRQRKEWVNITYEHRDRNGASSRAQNNKCLVVHWKNACWFLQWLRYNDNLSPLKTITHRLSPDMVTFEHGAFFKHRSTVFECRCVEENWRKAIWPVVVFFFNRNSSELR